MGRHNLRTPQHDMPGMGTCFIDFIILRNSVLCQAKRGIYEKVIVLNIILFPFTMRVARRRSLAGRNRRFNG